MINENTLNKNIGSEQSEIQDEFILLTRNKVRKLLGISFLSLTKLIEKGIIKTIRIQSREKISLFELKEFIHCNGTKNNGNLVIEKTKSTNHFDVLERSPEFILEELIKEYK